MAQTEPTNPLGVWTLLGTWLIALAVAVTSGQLVILYNCLLGFLAGDGAAIAQIEASPSVIITILGVYLTFDLPAALLSALAVNASLGDTDNALSKLFRGLQEKHYFQMIFLTVLVEEIFARWLFIGLLPQIIPGPITLYVGFLIGNGVWALVHLLNITDKTKRHPLRVLPQFVGGVLLTVIYLRYGFMATLLCHFAFDALVFCVGKKQTWGRSNLTLTLYLAMLAGASFTLMSSVTDTKLSAVSSWLSDQPVFAVEGWDFLDYVLLYVFIASIVGIVLELLAYDQNDVTRPREPNPPLWKALLYQLIGVLILLGGYSLLGTVMSSVPHRLILMALLLAMVSTSQSGSAMARTFWEFLPGAYLMVGSIVGLGVWGGLVFTLLTQIIMRPTRTLIRGTRTFQPKVMVSV